MFNSTDSETLRAEVATDKENNYNPPLESVSTDDFYGTDERFLEIHINFKLPNATAEFPIVCCLILIGCFNISISFLAPSERCGWTEIAFTISPC